MTDRRLALALLCLTLAACGPGGGGAEGGSKAGESASKAGQNAKARPQVVQTTISKQETVPLILESQGNVISLDEVDLHPQKTGTVSQIHVKEGDEVKQGQPVFSLDSRDDVANVKKAESKVAGDRAQLLIAQRDQQRNEDLATKGFISPSALDTTKAKLDAAQSTLAQDLAALESTRVQLSYDHIVAPFAGRVGAISIRPGSLVLANSTTSIVKITRINPVGVSFTLPERSLVDLQAAQKEGEAKITVTLASGEQRQGKVVFIDNSIDRTAGVISVKAELPNQDRQLWPGQYVPVRVMAGEVADAVTLPAQAVINSPSGRIVYLVKPDSTVASAAVDLVRVYQQRAIITGLDAGMKVVLEGGQNLRPGGKVIEASATAERGRKGGKSASAASGVAR